jgi:hypothetical protein
MKPRFTARSFQLCWLLILMLLGLTLSACASVRSTVATVAPGIRLTLTMANAPGSQLTQTAQRIPTRYVTATPPPQTPVPFSNPPGYPGSVLPTVTLAPYPPPYSNTGFPPLNSPLAQLVSTPTVRWSVQAIEVNWNIVAWGVNALNWINDSVAVLASNLSGYALAVDISDSAKPVLGQVAHSSETPEVPQEYNLACEDRLRIYRAADNQLIQEASIGNTCSAIEWSNNSSVVALVDETKTLYVWNVGQPAPIRVLQVESFAGMKWSPDSKRLAVIQWDGSSSEWQKAHVTVVSAIGELISPAFEIDVSNEGSPNVWWFANDIIVQFGRHEKFFYKASNGRHLFDWWDSIAMGPVHQQPDPSPDQRWLALDQGGPPTQDDLAPHKKYSLYDLQAQTEYVLLDRPNQCLAFIGWEPDSSKLYVVSRPGSPDAVSDPNVPYGFLRFDVFKREFAMLFKEALQVSWSASRGWAFVVFPSRNSDGVSGISGGIWQLGTETLAGRQQIAPEVVYQDPAWDVFFRGEAGIVHTDWSHDGTRVAFANAQGQVVILIKNGATQILTDEFPKDGWGKALYRWSPDDRHLLVQYGDHAWIVSVP